MNAMKGQPQVIPAEALKGAEEGGKKKKDAGDRFQKLILLDKQYPKK